MRVSLVKPRKGTATKARRARKRAADALLARNAAIVSAKAAPKVFDALDVILGRVS